MGVAVADDQHRYRAVAHKLLRDRTDDQAADDSMAATPDHNRAGLVIASCRHEFGSRVTNGDLETPVNRPADEHMRGSLAAHLLGLVEGVAHRRFSAGLEAAPAMPLS